jgi:hypothetical protein
MVLFEQAAQLRGFLLDPLMVAFTLREARGPQQCSGAQMEVFAKGANLRRPEYKWWYLLKRHPKGYRLHLRIWRLSRTCLHMR